MEEKMREEKLWCPSCQQGIGKLGESGVYSEGDTCPLCLKKGKPEDSRGTLMTVKQYEDQLAERAAYLKAEAKRKATKGQKKVEDHVAEAVAKAKEELRAEIMAEMESKTDELSKPKQETKSKPKEVKNV